MKEIAIIGGGFTGLTAALFLSKEGYEVTIYEREKFLGGLASGFEINGGHLEKAYHHFFKSDKYLSDMAEELGLSDKVKWFDSSVSIYYKGKNYPFNGAFDLLRFPPLSIFSRIRTGMLIFFLTKFNNWRIFQKVRASSFMKKYGGQKAFEVIWKPLLEGKFHNYADKISMAWLWARLNTRAKGRGIIEKEKLGYFEGGFNALVEAFKKELEEKGVKIVTNAEIKSIKNEESKVMINLADESRLFDTVLATVPSRILAKLIPQDTEPTYLQKLNSIDYIGAINLIFTSSKNLGENYWTNVNDEKIPFLVFINHTKLAPKKWYGNENVYYIGGYYPHSDQIFSLSEEEIFNKWMDGLESMFPNFSKNDVTSKYVFKFANAQNIVDLDYEKRIPEYKTPIENLYLSNFSQIYPFDRGTNYAIREGKKLGQIIHDKLKVETAKTIERNYPLDIQ